MDVINKAWAQVSDLFRSMTPAARLTTAALLLVIGLSVALLFRYQIQDTDSFLFAGRVLSDREIARLEAAFSKAGLNAWETAGNRIRVPRSERFAYIAAAADGNSLPENFDSVLEATIQSSSPFETKEQREMKRKYALQRELAHVIEEMSGVEKATVKYTEERSSAFARTSRKVALVAARSETNEFLDPEQVEAIRRTVASGIGASPEDVTVTDLRGPSYPGPSSDGTPSITDNLYASHKNKFEQLYRDKILNAFTMIPGFIVEVNVELDPRVSHASDMQTYSQPQPVRTMNTTAKTTTRSDPPGGRPGAVPNGALGNRAEEVAVTGNSSESTSNESHEESVAVVGQETVRVMEAGLTPKTVTATIQVPQSYFRKIWQEQNPAAADAEPKQPDAAELLRIEQDEIQRIEKSVQNLIPRLAAGQDPYPRVYIRSYLDAPADVPPDPTLAETAGSWLAHNWQTLGMAALAIAALLMVRGTLRAPKSGPAPANASPLVLAPETTGREDEQEDLETEAAEPALRRRVQPGKPNLRDELVELVREDPDAAATIISSWIGDAA